MAVCAQCGRESPDDFEFCPACGAALAAASAARREVRKVVTVLFCDLTGSTALGDRTDPEALRALMNRYYEAARSVLERHGGTVEKFVGDAVMAVFGIPQSSEDDALRAVRAAVEVRQSVHALGLEARIGVNTGEVVAGEGDTLVTGNAVNIAARLEQSAAPGEVLLGDVTVRLVRDAIEADAVELEVKGKTEPLAAHRLVALDSAAAGVTRHLDRPIVGRDRERERIRADFADAAAAGTCRLFTLIGPAGVGKSRLVADFLEHVGDTATVARGRALSYGEGITYWPLVEILLQLRLDPDEAIRSSPADTQLATRALLERTAQVRPLVIVLDDLQWAEPPLLDLVEHVADWSREAPILLLCIARPELLDVRPGWGGGKLNATSILLEPLLPAEAAALADTLLDGLALDGDTRARVLAAAEGNPLFIEEMSALARDAGDAVEVPPTIQAVLQARLDTLDERERSVIERGAVEGKIFHRGAVTALAPESLREEVPGRLLSLVRKELVRPERTQIAGDDAYRFRHLLIRDAAYEALPKATRAELHERFADWLDAHGDLLEQDEIAGYHLEQAARYLLELDTEDGSAAELATRAAERLGAAGIAAFEREDLHATRNLLGRAVALLPAGSLRRRLIPTLVDAKVEVNDVAGLGLLVEELERGDDRDRATAAALRALVDPAAGSTRTFTELAAAVEAAQTVLEDAGDLMGAARCERARAMLAWAACQAGECHRACLRCHELLRRAGSTAFQSDLITNIPRSAVFAGIPVAEIRALLDELDGEAQDAGPLLAASVRAARARSDFHAGMLTAEEVRAITLEHADLLRQTGFELEAEFALSFLSFTAILEGDDIAAEHELREKVERLEVLGDWMYLANALGDWGIALCAIGDAERALQAVARGREIARPDDIGDQVTLDAAEGYAKALQGDAEIARLLMGRARDALRGLDMVLLAERVEHVDAKLRAALGDTAGARTILERLAATTEGRGFVRFAELYRRDLAALD